MPDPNGRHVHVTDAVMAELKDKYGVDEEGWLPISSAAAWFTGIQLFPVEDGHSTHVHGIYRGDELVTVEIEG